MEELATASTWKQTMTRERRDSYVDGMVNVFRNMPKHSHIGIEEMTKLCRDYENDSVFAKASSMEDYKNRIEKK